MKKLLLSVTAIIFLVAGNMSWAQRGGMMGGGMGGGMMGYGQGGGQMMGPGQGGSQFMGPVFVKIVVAFSYAAFADFDKVFASAGGFNQTSPI